MVPVLETRRLLLRPPTLEDAPALQARFGRWAIIRNLSKVVPWPYPQDGAESFLRDVLLPGMARGDRLAWALTLKDGDGSLIGLLDWVRDAGKGRDNRGFWLAEEFHRQGLMTEAVVAFQDHLFFECKVPRIHVSNSVTNPASRRIKEKTGARYLGLGHLDLHEGDGTVELWEVRREDWAKLRGWSLT